MLITALEEKRSRRCFTALSHPVFHNNNFRNSLAQEMNAIIGVLANFAGGDNPIYFLSSM